MTAAPPRPSAPSRRPAHLLALAAAALAATACRKEAVADMDYDDPQKAIAAMEDTHRDSWEMPDQVVRSLKITEKDAVIADIGAGSGYFSRRLAAEVPAGKVYAVEIDDEFRSYIESQREGWGAPNIEAHLAYYDDPALPEKAVDLVFIANTYAYLRSRVDYLRKCRRALKPGGRLVVIDFRPDAAAPEQFAPDPKYRVPPETVVADLAQAGFTLEREETFLPYQYFLVFQMAAPAAR